MAKKELPIKKLQNMQEKAHHGIPTGVRNIQPGQIDELIKKMSSQSTPEGWSEMYTQRQQIFRDLLKKLKEKGKRGFSSWS